MCGGRTIFAKEVGLLRLTAAEAFRSQNILAVTQALLQSSVAYVAGYQGAPVSHLMDVLADAGIGTSTLQSRCLAGLAKATFIFCLPGSRNAVATGWDKLIEAQLDTRTRTRPGNLALIKRMEEVESLRADGLPTVPTTMHQEKRTNWLRLPSANHRVALSMK